MCCSLIEREVGHGVGWNDVQMAVRNFKTSNDKPNTSAFVQLLLSVADACRYSYEMIRCGRRKIRPLIYFLDWNHQRMSSGDGVYRQERYAGLIFMHEMARYLSANNAGKQRRHSGDCSVGNREH